MRLVLQRVTEARVSIDGKVHSNTGHGLLVLFGSKTGDNEESCGQLADKIVNLRIFEDDNGLMNRSILDIGGEIMIVSQFTLYADTRKGRRPSFGQAMEPVEAERLYDLFVHRVEASELRTLSGVFGATMQVQFTNDGPVTIILDHD